MAHERATPHTVRAPRGTQRTCKGWIQEAAMRMLMNNLDPDVAEKPDELIVYGGAGKAARNWECYEEIVRSLIATRKRRDAPRAVGETRRDIPHARERAPGSHRQRHACAPLGDVGRVPAAGGTRAHDVRADDRRELDLHRLAGDPPGDIRDIRGVRKAIFRRHARRAAACQRGTRGDGRRPAARGDHERGRLPYHRSRPRAGSRSGSGPVTSTRWRRRSTGHSLPSRPRGS